MPLKTKKHLRKSQAMSEVLHIEMQDKENGFFIGDEFVAEARDMNADLNGIDDETIKLISSVAIAVFINQHEVKVQ